MDIPVPTQFNLNPTSRIVFGLCAQLQPLIHRFILFCDNYFSNIALFEALREFRIAACGTVRPNSALYPKCLKIKKQRAALPWGTLGGVVVGRVLAVIWQDKTLVRFLTTAYDMRPENVINRSRRRPYTGKNTEAQFRTMINTVWGEESVKVLPLPVASVDYNLFMGGVDISDQRRSYFSTQLRSVRTWMPLFYWLLDTTIINAFLIAKQSIGGKKNTFYTDQRKFMENLCWALVKDGEDSLHPNIGVNSPTSAPLSETRRRHRNQESQIRASDGAFTKGTKPVGNTSRSRSKGYVGRNFKLPECRKDPQPHRSIYTQRQYCMFCRFLNQQAKKDNFGTYANLFFHDPNGPHGRVRQTSFTCSHCIYSGAPVPLCKEFCHMYWHQI